MKPADYGGNGGCREAIGLSFDGLLEGDESQCYRSFYRMSMLAFFGFSLVGIILPLASIGGAGGLGVIAPLTGLAVAGLLGSTMTLIRWYRVDGLEPKLKKLAFALIFTTLLADIVAVAVFSKNSESPTPCPIPTPCPVPQDFCMEQVYVTGDQAFCHNNYFQAVCAAPMPPCLTPMPTQPGQNTPRPYYPPGPTYVGKAFKATPVPAPVTPPPAPTPAP